MKIKDVMSQDLVTAPASSDVMRAVELMKDKQIGCIVVTSSKSAVGILTDRDLLMRGFSGGRWFGPDKLSDYMTAPVVTVTPETDILEAVHIMNENSIRRLPVEENGELVGIVSWSDLAEALDDPLHELVSSHSKPRAMAGRT